MFESSIVGRPSLINIMFPFLFVVWIIAGPCDLKSQNASEKEVPQNLSFFHSSLVPFKWPSNRNNPSFPPLSELVSWPRNAHGKSCAHPAHKAARVFLGENHRPAASRELDICINVFQPVWASRQGRSGRKGGWPTQNGYFDRDNDGFYPYAPWCWYIQSYKTGWFLR